MPPTLSIKVASEFTPTEARIIAVLSDGRPHARRELLACLWDSDGSPSNVQTHVSRIRAKLRPIGQDIVCECGNHPIRYRHVRSLVPITDRHV